MPSARSATAASRRSARPAARAPVRRPPRLAGLREPMLRVRWDRAGRIALLGVIAVVIGIYAQRTLAYLSTSSRASREQAVVNHLRRDNATLARQVQALNQPATIVQDARALGMVRPGERSYVLTGHAASR